MFEVIAAWQQSGISQKQYCEEQGIRYHVFHYWFRKYREQNQPSPCSGFIPLEVLEQASSFTGIELIIPNGYRILFNQPVSAAFLKQLIG